MPGVIDASEVNCVYDIIIKITSDELRKIERYYNTTENNRYSQVNERNGFCYNDTVWILFAIALTLGMYMTAVIISCSQCKSSNIFLRSSFSAE